MSCVSRPPVPLLVALAQAVAADDAGSGFGGLRQHRAGDLIVPSGHLVACDPGFPDAASLQPLTPPLLPGRYPVLLGIAQGADGDLRVAYALLQVSAQPPVRWVPAGRANTPPGEAAPASYTVESGLGCFMDVQAARVLVQRLRADPEYNVRIAEAVDAHFVDTWGCATLSLTPQTRANLIAFSSGAGEGVYATYVGYDAAERVSCLVTDFALLWGPP
jgi:hypothetical protein